jgi:hypothetical protein
VYDSSFRDEFQSSYLSTVSVGSDQSLFGISVNVQAKVLSCTVVTYNRILLNVFNCDTIEQL